MIINISVPNYIYKKYIAQQNNIYKEWQQQPQRSLNFSR